MEERAELLEDILEVRFPKSIGRWLVGFTVFGLISEKEQ